MRKLWRVLGYVLASGPAVMAVILGLTLTTSAAYLSLVVIHYSIASSGSSGWGLWAAALTWVTAIAYRLAQQRRERRDQDPPAQ